MPVVLYRAELTYNFSCYFLLFLSRVTLMFRKFSKFRLPLSLNPCNYRDHVGLNITKLIFDKNIP